VKLSRRDWAIGGALLLLALFIWLRDLYWINSSSDTLPILVALPLFIWLGSPWTFRPDPLPLSIRSLIGGSLLLFFGAALNSALALAIGWTYLLWTWLKASLEPAQLPTIKKLLILPLLAFPWIILDVDRLGWWFRLSGAWTAAHFFSLLGFDVTLEGTQLLIEKLPISVEAACAGLNTLQAMLIAGSVVAFFILGDTPFYWWNIPLLIAAAWLTNTIRVILLSWVALKVSPEFALGPFHEWGGWAIILLMFGLCWLLFSLQKSLWSRT
jgi:exosortase/archaeosortase family protein